MKDTPWDSLGIKKQFAIHMEIERELSRSVDRSVIGEVYNIVKRDLDVQSKESNHGDT